MTEALLAPDHTSTNAPAPWGLVRRSLPAVGLAGACCAAAIAEVPADEGAILCPFRLLTGGWCPGCGGTRALRHLMHGDLQLSLTLNPLLLVLLVQAVVISAALLRVPDRTRAWFRLNDLRLVQVNIGIAVALWVARLITGQIPRPFQTAAPILELWSTAFG